MSLIAVERLSVVAEQVGDELALFTVIVTEGAVATFPAASRATAVIVCVPLGVGLVSQLSEYGGVVFSVPRFAPSNLNCTPTTPTLSEALAETVTVPETVAPFCGAAMETVGRMTSTPACVVALTITDFALVLPATSWAATAYE